MYSSMQNHCPFSVGAAKAFVHRPFVHLDRHQDYIPPNRQLSSKLKSLPPLMNLPLDNIHIRHSAYSLVLVVISVLLLDMDPLATV